MNEQNILIPFNASYITLSQFIKEIENIISMAKMVNDQGIMVSIGDKTKRKILYDIAKETTKWQSQ